MDLVGTFQKLTLEKLYPVNLYYINILNLVFMSDNSVMQKISTKFAIIIASLCII